MPDYENYIFKCDRQEKQHFMKDCEQMEINGSMMLRRFIHLFLTDKAFRTAALNLNDPNHFYVEDF